MESVLAIWWLVMTRVSYWWMRTNLTLKLVKFDVMCFLTVSFLHVVIHSGICWRKVPWGLFGTCRYCRYFLEFTTCTIWWQVLIRKYCEGYSSSTGLKFCIDTPLVLLLKNTCWVPCFQLHWLKWAWANLSSHRVRIQVQRMNWYFPPILARLILWWGGNKMEVD